MKLIPAERRALELIQRTGCLTIDQLAKFGVKEITLARLDEKKLIVLRHRGEDGAADYWLTNKGEAELT